MTERIDSDVVERVRQTVARVFKMNVTATEGLRMGQHPRWDSLGHMELIMEVEKEFGLRFPIYEIAELQSTEAIFEAVERHGQK